MLACRARFCFPHFTTNGNAVMSDLPTLLMIDFFNHCKNNRRNEASYKIRKKSANVGDKITA